jgi:hypothetical protein
MNTIHELVDISDIIYDFNKSKEERSIHFLKYIKNPYKYKHGKHTIIIEFGNSGSFDDCFASGLQNSGL